MAGDGGVGAVGKVTCAAWIRRRDDGGPAGVSRLLVACGHGATASSPPLLDLLAFDARASELAVEPLARVVMGGEGADPPRAIAVHPGGREFACATAKGCRLFKLVYKEFGIHLISRDTSPLQSAGLRNVWHSALMVLSLLLVDGHLLIFHWPSLNMILDEPKAHKSFRDMDISLDSEFLVSTSTDGSARIWKINDGAPLVNLTRSPDEKIECCRLSRDGTKPFLFCTLVKGRDVLTVVLDISNWKRIGYKRLSAKPISTLSVSLDRKYLALAVISTSHQWGAEITKLDVPADWKVWQIWLVLLSLFVASAVFFFAFFKHARINL